MTRLPCAAFAVATLLSGIARGDEPNERPAARCVAQFIHALADGHGVDPKLDKLKPYLAKAPFTAWKRFVLLDEKKFHVAPNDTDRFTLPNGKQLSITYVEHVVKDDQKHRLRLRLEVDDGPKKLLNTTFTLKEGGMVLEAGQKHAGGLLVLGLSCETPK